VVIFFLKTHEIAFLSNTLTQRILGKSQYKNTSEQLSSGPRTHAGPPKHVTVEIKLILVYCIFDRLCGLVVRVPGYRSRCHGYLSQLYEVFCEVVGLERGALSLVKITE
jgi:hypothetical protein